MIAWTTAATDRAMTRSQGTPWPILISGSIFAGAALSLTIALYL